MGTNARVWIEVGTDRRLTEDEQSALEKFGRVSCAKPDDCRAHDRGLVLGWLSFYEAEAFMLGLATALPEGVSASICQEWADCDEPGKEWAFIGPRALELESKWCDDRIRELQQQLESVKSRLPAIPANAPAPTANLLDWPIV